MPHFLTLMFAGLSGPAVRLALRVAAALVDPNDALVIAFRNAINAISDARGTSASLSIVKTQAGVATESPYEDNEDKLAMKFLDAAGETHIHYIPSCKSTIFAADGFTATGAAVDALRDAILTNCRTPQGLAYSSFIGGYRVRRDTKSR